MSKATAEGTREHISSWLEAKAAKFRMEIQVHADAASEQVQHMQHQSWALPWQPVGILTVPPQALDGQGCGEHLLSSLKASLATSAEEEQWIHKSLQFHPIRTIDDFFPTGDVQQFRCRFYAAFAEMRTRQLSQGRCEIKTLDWDVLFKEPELARLFGLPELAYQTSGLPN